MGLFQDLQRNQFSPLLLSKDNGAGEDITFGDDQSIVALVPDDLFLETPEDEQPEVRGQIHIKDSDRATLQTTQTVTIRGEIFHITGYGTPGGSGLVPVNVKRHKTENSNTNQFDLNEEQATWNS